MTGRNTKLLKKLAAYMYEKRNREVKLHLPTASDIVVDRGAKKLKTWWLSLNAKERGIARTKILKEMQRGQGGG